MLLNGAGLGKKANSLNTEQLEQKFSESKLRIETASPNELRLALINAVNQSRLEILGTDENGAIKNTTVGFSKKDKSKTEWFYDMFSQITAHTIPQRQLLDPSIYLPNPLFEKVKLEKLNQNNPNIPPYINMIGGFSSGFFKVAELLERYSAPDQVDKIIKEFIKVAIPTFSKQYHDEVTDKNYKNLIYAMELVNYIGEGLK